jgi:hypothetical protein
VIDQAALHSWLQKLRDLNASLISITQVDPEPQRRPTLDGSSSHERGLTRR